MQLTVALEPRPGREDASTFLAHPAVHPDLRLLLASLCPEWRGPALAFDAHSLELRFANRHALEMLAYGYPARLAGGRLTISSAGAMRRLRNALSTMTADAGQTAMVVVDDQEVRATYALRLAIPALPAPHVGGQIVVADVIKAALEPASALLYAIAEAFELTAAERSVLGHLAAGLSLREIAALRQVRIETVRHQCKNVLSKMRCRRQADLVRVVAGLSQRDATGFPL